MKKPAVVIIMFILTLVSSSIYGDDTQPVDNPEQNKYFSIGASLLYGWYYQSFVVAKGDLKQKYIQGVADFESDVYDGGGGAFISIFGTRVDLSYVGTDGFTFSDIQYRGLSFTLDAKLWSFPWSSYNEIMETSYLHEMHIRYKHNRVTASKDFGSYSGFTEVEQDYHSNWYNVALVYNHTMSHTIKGSPYLDGKFWGGLSSGGFNYNSGLDWTDISSVQHRNEIFIKSDGFYPGINIGFDVTFGTDYDRGFFMNFGIDSIFVFDAPVKSSVADEERVLIAILEFKGSAEYKFASGFSLTVSGTRTLNQSVARDADYNGITFIEESKYYQAAVSASY
jgi:hypothetical protein